MGNFMPYTRAGTTLPWSKTLEENFTFESNYDGPIQVFQKSLDCHSVITVPRQGVPIQTLDLRDSGIAVNFNTTLFKARNQEQTNVVHESVSLLMKDDSHIISAPTGAGKTIMATQIAGLMGKRFCVITTKEDILYQWVEALQKVLGLKKEEIGIWRGDQVPTLKHKAVVSLIQSVAKGPERYGVEPYNGFGLVIADETHRLGAEGFSQAMWHFPAKLRLGLSATPYRRDGKDQVFLWHIGPVKVTATQEVLVPKVIIHKTGWKTKVYHDFGNLSLLLRPMALNIERNQTIVKYLLGAKDKGRSTVFFSDTLEHLDIVSDMLLQSGVPENDIGFFVGISNEHYLPRKSANGKQKARDIRKKHATRPIVLATYAMMKEGTDIPWLDTCILGTPKADVTQIVGRIRREYEGKKPPVVIDLVDESPVLSAYAGSRQKWYSSLGAEIVRYAN